MLESIKRGLKQGLLRSPAAVRDSTVLRAGFRMRERIKAGSDGDAGSSAEDGMPIPPARLRVAVSGIADPEDHIRAGRESALAIEGILGGSGIEVAQLRAILDFGCGSGRVTRRWAGLGGTEVHGCDYNEDAIRWCQANLPFASWSANQLSPPLPYPDQRFQLVYALSVFTHLPTDLQDAWMREMKRVVEPGGYLIFTTMGQTFREHLTPDEQAEFDAGGLIVHFPGSAGSNMCAVYHPLAAVNDLLGRTGFTLLDSVPAGTDRSAYPQDMWLARAATAGVSS